jgi:hypothetical protein
MNWLYRAWAFGRRSSINEEKAMKGDFSRLRFGNGEDRAQVLMQQGRVLLDADWNAQGQFLARALERAQRNLIGTAGGPADDLGFGITGHSALALNSVDCGGGQYLHLNHSPTLPFASAWRFDEILPDGPEYDPSQPPCLCYAIEMTVVVPAAASGVLLCRPGSFSLQVRSDRRLALVLTDDWPVERAAENPLPEHGLLTVAVVALPWARQVFLDGRLVIEAPAEFLVGAAVAAAGGVALAVGAAINPESGRGGDFLPLRLDYLRIWRRPIPGQWLHRAKTPDPHGLVCDLTFDSLHHGLARDRSGWNNDGRLHPRQASWEPTIVGLHVGQGQYYIDGAQVVNPQSMDIRRQPCPPVEASSAGGMLAQGHHLAYLEVWDRFVTSLQQPALREVALGGPDTAGYLSAAWRVGMIHAADKTGRDAQWVRLTQAARRPGRVAMRSVTPAVAAVGNDLYRIEIAAPGWALDRGSPWAPSEAAAVAAPLEIQSGEFRLRDALVREALEAGAAASLLVEWQGRWLVIPVAVKDFHPDGLIVLHRTNRILDLDAVLALALELLPDGESRDGAGTATIGLRLLPLATFKCSRRNGSVAYAVVGIQADLDGANAGAISGTAQLTVDDLRALDIHPGDWVELTNDTVELQRRSGPMFRVGAIDRGLAEVQLLGCNPQTCPLDIDPTEHPLIRRWESNAEHAARLDVGREDHQPPVYAIEPGRWVALGQGVEVRFDGGGWYGPADYWTAPIRQSAIPALDWPGGEHPLFLDPEGPKPRLVRLADIDNANGKAVIHDRRRSFAPLATEDPPVPAPLQSALRALADGFTTWAREHHSWPPATTQHAVTDFIRYAAGGALGIPLQLMVDDDRPSPHMRKSGTTVAAQCLPVARWQRQPAPEELTGPCLAVAVGGACHVLTEANGGVWRLDPAAAAETHLPVQAWRRLAVRPQLREKVAIAAIGDLLAIIGGHIRGAPHATPRIDLLYPDGEWREARPLPNPRQGAAAASIGGRLFVAGGRDGQLDEPDNSLWMLPPGGEEWVELASMTNRRAEFALVAYEGRLYALGGNGPDHRLLAEAERYDPDSNTWTPIAALPAAAHSPAAAPIAGGIVVAGGGLAADRCHDVVMQYQPDFDQWHLLAPLDAPRRRIGLATVGGGQLLAVGGLGCDSLFIGGLERLRTTRRLAILE